MYLGDAYLNDVYSGNKKLSKPDMTCEHSRSQNFTMPGQQMIPSILAAFALTVLTPSLVFADGWKFSSGIDYSSGDYGADKDTDILYIPFSGSYKSGPWTGKVTVPWIRIEGPGGVTGGGDGVVVIKPNKGRGKGTTTTTTTARSTTSTESGLGDVWASLKYEVESFPLELGYLDVTGKIKFPTADEDDGLGTGEMDYTLQVDYAKPLGRLTPLLSVTYKIKGDPSGVDLDNVWYVSAGTDWQMKQGLNVGVTLDFQETSSSGADDALELFTYLSYRLSDSWSAMPYLYKGFTDGSPDLGGGVSLTYRM